MSRPAVQLGLGYQRLLAMHAVWVHFEVEACPQLLTFISVLEYKHQVTT